MAYDRTTSPGSSSSSVGTSTESDSDRLKRTPHLPSPIRGQFDKLRESLQDVTSRRERAGLLATFVESLPPFYHNAALHHAETEKRQGRTITIDNLASFFANLEERLQQAGVGQVSGDAPDPIHRLVKGSPTSKLLPRLAEAPFAGGKYLTDHHSNNVRARRPSSHSSNEYRSRSSSPSKRGSATNEMALSDFEPSWPHVSNLMNSKDVEVRSPTSTSEGSMSSAIGSR